MAAPVAQRYLQTLTEAERAMLHRVMQAVERAGGMLDTYSTANLSRFCVHNKWDEEATLKMVLKAVAWRTSGEGVGADRVRAELLEGTPLLQLSGGFGAAVAKLNVFVPGHPFLGTTRQGDPFEICVPGRLGLNTLDGKALLQATTDAEFWQSNLAYMEFRSAKCDVLCLEGDLRLKSLYMLSDGAGTSLIFLRKVYRRFARTAPIADLYYPLYLRKSLLLNAPSTVSAVFQLFKPLLSREITDTFHIFRAADAAKAHALITADIDHRIVPRCYGGTLERFTPQMHAEIGLDALEPALFAQQYVGPVENLGKFHLPQPATDSSAASARPPSERAYRSFGL